MGAVRLALVAIVSGAACSGSPAGDPVTLAKAPAIGLAIDGSAVYWTDDSASVMTMPKSGGKPAALFVGPGGGNMGGGIAVDATAAYFVWSYQTIMKVPLDGSAPVMLDQGHEGFGTLVIDTARAYWLAPDTAVEAVPLGGGSATALVGAGSASAGFGWAIASDAAYVYWATSDRALRRVAKADGTATVLAMTAEPIACIAVDATNVYWVERAALFTVYELPLAGGTPVQLAQLSAPNAGIRAAIAVDATHVYWTDDHLRRVPIAGGAVETIAGADAWAVAADATGVYWADDGVDIRKLAR